MDAAEELYLKGIYFYVGEFEQGLWSIESGYDCIEKAAKSGHKRARELMSLATRSYAPKNVIKGIMWYAMYDAVKLGSECGFNMLKRTLPQTSQSNTHTSTEIAEFEYALRHFTKQNARLTLNANLMYEIALRYYVGDFTGRQNTTNGKKWLAMASSKGHKEAQRILLAPNTLHRAYVEATVLYGSVRAIKKVTDWHKKHTLSLSDYELIEFAQAVVKLGDIY